MPSKPGWRNWQTQRTQNPPTFGSWGFDSPSRHHSVDNPLTEVQSWFRSTASTPSYLEPITAIGYPPGHEKNRDRCRKSPPERKHKIGKQTQQHEDRPEYLFLHRGNCTDILFVTLVYGLLVYAVILSWISFTSAFPACRSV